MQARQASSALDRVGMVREGLIAYSIGSAVVTRSLEFLMMIWYPKAELGGEAAAKCIGKQLSPILER